jgi:SAM-dependent methyltransferase
MPLAYRTEENNPLVLALCQDTPGWDGLNLDVDERDEMLGFFLDILEHDRERALALYFRTGHQIWETLRTVLAWRFGNGLGRVGKLLDFASGFGRVTRFLVQDVPPERVWISDIYADAVRFQAATFGVHGLVSAADPADFRCDERFDAILVSSLFTHLPEATFHGWLRRLWSLLAPGGILIFSVHDSSLFWPPREMPASGLLFQAVSESGSLDTGQYGSSWVTEDFVRRAIAALPATSPGATGGASAARLPRGLLNFQDLWVAVDEPGVDFTGLRLRGRPEVYVEHCSFEPPDCLRVRGWAVDRRGAPIREIRLSLGEEVLAGTRAFEPRPDVAGHLPATAAPQGWALEVHLPRGTSRPAGVLKLWVVDADGAETVAEASTLEAALQRSATLELSATRRELERTREELEAYRTATRETTHQRNLLQIRVAALDARLAAMEASAFWRLRNGWFALKRRLGLTDQP